MPVVPTQRILTLPRPVGGLSTIVNVIGRVGPDEANDPADVRVVQRLIQLCGANSPAGARIGLPAVTGRFDAATGFWVYEVQSWRRRGDPNQVVDGIVSPARGASYGGAYWTIFLLNLYAKEHSPTEYSAFVASGGTT